MPFSGDPALHDRRLADRLLEDAAFNMELKARAEHQVFVTVSLLCTGLSQYNNLIVLIQ